MSEAYVLDTSALMQAYVKDTSTAAAKHLLSLLGDQDGVELHFLNVGLAEGVNVVWKRVRFLDMDVEYALRVVNNLRGLPLIVHEVDELLADALTLGLSHNLAVYDALYIALARHLALPLVTADTRQGAAAEAAGVTVTPLSAFAPAP